MDKGWKYFGRVAVKNAAIATLRARCGNATQPQFQRRLRLPAQFGTALLLCWFWMSGLSAVTVFAAEVIPPKPQNHFNDYAGVVARSTATELNGRLESFEKESSSQIVVAIYPKMESNSSVQDYTLRVARSWKAGLEDKRNGAILFVFVSNHQMFLQVGYGLEGAIPDATAKDITEFVIKPAFQKGDYDGGLRAGVDAILKAARGEYRGTGRTVAQQRGRSNGRFGFVFWFIIVMFALSLFSQRRRGRGRVYGGSGWAGWGGGPWSGGGGGRSSGGGSPGGGGTFSAGGGDFGGGGAGSSW